MAHPSWHVLLVDDDEDDYYLTRERLSQARGRKILLEWASTYETGQERISAGHFDAVLVDYDLGARTGVELIREMSAKNHPTPAILLTGRGNYDVDVEAMQAGATLYITKDEANPLLLERTIRYAIERKQAEDALRRARDEAQANEERLRLAQQAGGVGFFDGDMVSGQSVWTEQLDTIYGLKPGEGSTAAWAKMIHPDDKAAADEGMLQAIHERREEVTGDFRIIRADGQVRWLSNRGLIYYDASGQPLRMIGASVDITERKRMEEALQRNQQILNQAGQMAHLGGWELEISNHEDLNANPLHWSDEVYRIFGYEPGAVEISNELFFAHVPAEEQELISQAVAQAIADRKVYSIEHRIRRLDGVERTVLEHGEVIFDENGRLERIIGAVQDITERKQAEAALQARNDEIKSMTQQLWQTAKLATMGELAASVAHELNNPLAILSLRVELLASKLRESTPEGGVLAMMEGDLAIIEQEIYRMADLVSNLLQSSRSEERQISSLDMAEEINRTLELVHNHLKQRQITVKRMFSTGIPMVLADRQQMRQLILNLISNASDAMPKGGMLTVSVRACEDPSRVAIEVQDSGTGIAAENLSRVMEPFFTTKPEGKGTGLGLAICRRIVEEHQGSIQISSLGKNQGTAVEITLPRTNRAKPSFRPDE